METDVPNDRVEELLKRLDRLEERLNEILISQKEMLSFDEARIYLHLSPSYLYKITASRSIAFFKPNGKLVYFRRVTGTTNSSDFKFYYGSNVPYEDSTLSGSRDAFFAQFDSTGRRIWATYFGGQYTEDGTGVDVDYWNDVYFVGFTNSDNMYTRNAAYLYNQSTIGASTSSISNWGDGYVFMLKPNLQPTWCTYFGGNHVDGIWGVSVKGSTSTAIFGGYAGSNDSTTFPIAGTGANWTNAGWGNDDAFYSMVNITNIYLTPTEIQEDKPIHNNELFALYPNPNNGQLVVNVGQQGIPQTLVITNTLGQTVYLQNKPQTDANGHIYLDVQNLNDGVYFLNLYYGDKSETQKFSITR